MTALEAQKIGEIGEEEPDCPHLVPELDPQLDPQAAPLYPELPVTEIGPLRFAPEPEADPAPDAAPPVRISRSGRTDRRWGKWVERAFEASWIMLALACAAECVYRLLWAVQPLR